jgi:hypothetical protein
MLALGAILPAAASAEPNRNQSTRATEMPVPVQIVRVAAPAGFDWGDAGIGAASGVGLVMLALGGSRGLAGRRARTGASSAAAN